MKTVLLVDDSEAEQFLYKSIIELFDRRIHTISAYDGIEAMDVVQNVEGAIDAILLDINMPRANGIEFLETCGQNFERDNVVIAIMTSSLHPQDKKKAMAHDCVACFFEKPLTTDHLQELSNVIKDA